ncbi:hypothetical protein [Thermus scotoductus]|uniref:Uncharacterized protein n=1 Tax=Thermus scotoductus TaxID=37636 RepID=A0A430QZ91_THESC|nr:hypothetical protein [Thermus scotoductus]RTG93445.1 hypothetical protein CSW49_10740 [Thermus scotoductus]RTH00454.1 hypothetical protein CSW45_13550 [Thermus scotoductus]RTH16036.1 hypothetical protein CSW42_13830 [Thermus scotoductus]RTH96114.1 hypothetical protein CSW28_13880 [Thermus scotoductus]RTI17587.1 hypothetical protein CSW21_13235 [Thermus scotoductus]
MMTKRTKELLKWGALGAVGVLGGAYVLYRVNPSLSDRVGATWLLQKFRLAPVVYAPAEDVPIYPATYTPPPAPPQTVVGQELISVWV